MTEPSAHVDITIVAPSKNEASNVRLLVKRLAEHLGPLGRTWEILFADDSDDDTLAVLDRLRADGFPVRVNHRREAERIGGQSGALVEAFSIVRGEVVVVIDADLKHPIDRVTDLATPLLDGDADVAVGSRYRPGASATSLDGWWHHMVSQGSASVYKAMFREVRRVTDPGSGFYAFRREVIDHVVLKPERFKVLVEILVRGRWRRHVEVPALYAGRMYGARRVTARQIWRFGTHTLRLWLETRVDPQRYAETPDARAYCADRAEQLGTEQASPADRHDAERPLDVLVVASEAPPIESGVALAVGRITDGLQARGHRVTVLSTEDAWRRIYGEFRLSGLGVRLVAESRRLSEFDVVNLHGPVPTLSELVFLAHRLRPRRRRPRLVYTHHCDVEVRGLGVPLLAYNALHRLLARRADDVIVTTPSYARVITGHTAGIEPWIVPWAVDPPRLEVRREPYLGDRPLRVLFVGQQRHYKGVHVLIQAVAGSPHLELTVAGAGPLLGQHRELARRLGARNITILGRIADDERDRHFARHDVIALPSITGQEAFGIVLLEGMQQGCVPIASDLSGVRDVVGTAGVLVPPRRAARLREQLESLARDPDRVRALSQAAIDRAARFTWDRCVTHYETVLCGSRHER